MVCCSIAAALTGLSSCADFLEIKPQSEIILEDFWNEKADVENVVMGCYSALQSDAVRKRMIVWGEVRSDNVMSGQNINNDVNLYNIVRENITAMNTYTTWDGFYDVINRCNTVLKYAPGVAAEDPGYTQGDLKATIAEVSALRDLCYFYLIRTFRNVPYSTVAFTDNDQTMDLPATPFEDVLDSLINDLESIKADAVVRYPEAKPRYQTGRITRDAIYAMLCEMYLWKKDYDNCIRYAELVIDSKKLLYEEERSKGNSGGTMSLSSLNVVETRLNGYPLVADRTSGNMFGDAYEAIFADGASRETIFELNYDANPESSGMPSSSAISSFYGNSDSHKGLLAPTSAILDDVTATSGRTIYEDKNKTLDARLYQNLDAEGGSITKFASRSVSINMQDASKPSASYSYYTSNNNSSQWIIYRLPDIMLLEAEAICQQMQEGSEQSVIDFNAPKLQKCFALVNAINKRSICKAQLLEADTLKLADYNTKSLMEELVQRERRRELMYEGKRWYDLVRYAMRDGNTNQVVSAVQKRDDVNATFAQNFFKKMDAIFWPYNNEEMKVNRNLIPNPVFGSGESTSYEKSK
ncbi:MAG: RagB/SusD family nutrient uptake outer membrane protein [Prevotella sp.]|nr:RagB/SusD family nutrient uptake outer membrane protein [Prevotella sp.]